MRMHITRQYKIYIPQQLTMNHRRVDIYIDKQRVSLFVLLKLLNRIDTFETDFSLVRCSKIGERDREGRRTGK